MQRLAVGVPSLADINSPNNDEVKKISPAQSCDEKIQSKIVAANLFNLRSQHKVTPLAYLDRIRIPPLTGRYTSLHCGKSRLLVTQS